VIPSPSLSHTYSATVQSVDGRDKTVAGALMVNTLPAWFEVSPLVECRSSTPAVQARLVGEGGGAQAVGIVPVLPVGK
jgi:hypothetical protein